MTEAMKITLSTQPADARWGEKATYSINNDGITLHLNGKDDLGLIQRAANWMVKAGIPNVAGRSGRVTKDQKAPAKLSGPLWTRRSAKSWITA